MRTYEKKHANRGRALDRALEHHEMLVRDAVPHVEPVELDDVQKPGWTQTPKELEAWEKIPAQTIKQNNATIKIETTTKIKARIK